MFVVRGPVSVNMGSPADEPGHEKEEAIVRKTVPYSFAVSLHEVTLEQMQQYQPGFAFAEDVTKDIRCPATKVSFDDAVRYCRWLSEQEGVPEEQMCYNADSTSGAGNAHLSDERLRRTGYRLLTEVEWEYVCRAKSTTPWHCGSSEEHLTAFAWFAVNSPDRVNPVGLLLPNSFGLFDMAGNVVEWCHSGPTDSIFRLRGGTYDDQARMLRSAHQRHQSNTGYSLNGFRLARTIAGDP
jgi:formylglycine-generating enzyme required for sulfatase activity